MAIKPFNYSNPQQTASLSGNIKPYVYAPYTASVVTPQVEQPSLISRGISAVKNYANESANKVVPFGNTVINVVTHPLQSLINFGNFVSEPAKTAITGVAESGVKLVTDRGVANTVANTANLISNIAGTAFSPITSTFKIAEEVPGLKQVADTINIPFTTTGFAGSWASGKAIDWIPKEILPQESKDIIKQPVQQLTSLIAQVALGGKIMKKIGTFAKKGEVITPEKATQIIEEVRKEVKTETAPTIKPFDYTKPASEQITKPTEAPVALESARTEMRIPKTGQTTIQYHGTPADVSGGLKPSAKGTLGEGVYLTQTPEMAGSFSKQTKTMTGTGEVTSSKAKVNILSFDTTPLKLKVLTNKSEITGGIDSYRKSLITEGYDGIELPTETVVFPESVGKLRAEPIAGAPKPIETIGNEFTSRVFERMKAENPEILTGDLEVQRTNLKQDAQKAVDLVAKDKQQAYRIAMGAETSPEVTSTAVNIALADKAISDGNYDLAGRLIKNRSLEQTRRGQEIVAERGSVTDNSASKYIKELVASRLDSLGKQYLGDLSLGKLKARRVADKTKAIEKINKEVSKVETQIKGKKLDTKTALALLDKLTCV